MSRRPHGAEGRGASATRERAGVRATAEKAQAVATRNHVAVDPALHLRLSSAELTLRLLKHTPAPFRY